MEDPRDLLGTKHVRSCTLLSALGVGSCRSCQRGATRPVPELVAADLVLGVSEHALGLESCLSGLQT